MEKGCGLVVLAVLLVIGLYIFWGWVLSLILAIFSINITLWQGAMIVVFISFIANLFKD